MAFGIDLSELATDSDIDLFRSAACAIQRSMGRGSGKRAIGSLTDDSQVVLRLYGFVALFGNGGLQHWFETDDPDLHPSTVDALRLVGLERGASALEQAYALFTSRDAWDVYDERMDLLAELCPEFEQLEGDIWAVFNDIEVSGGQFVRARLQGDKS